MVLFGLSYVEEVVVYDIIIIIVVSENLVDVVYV